MPDSKLPVWLANVLKQHAPDVLEKVEAAAPEPVVPAAPKAAQPTPTASTLSGQPDSKAAKLKEALQTNLVKMNSAIDTMLTTIKDAQASNLSSEMLSIASVFLTKAKQEISKHSGWLKNR